MVGRNEEKAFRAVEEVVRVSNSNDTNKSDSNHHSSRDRIFPMACDHSSFRSVNQFCEDLKNHLDAESSKEGYKVGIDVLCLNAAVFLGEDAEVQYTKDNLEVTVQTNHFAPFLIAHRLFDRINPGARVVITSSGLHAVPGTSFGNFEGAIDSSSGKIRDGFGMVDGTSFDHKRCYAISKLCNVAFCLELNRRLQQRNALAVCFTPGLIPSSGLFRHQKRWHDTCLKTHGMAMAETEEWGGAILAWMAFSDVAGMEGGCYWRAPFGISQRGGKIPDDLSKFPVNDEANDLKNQQILWEISATLTSASYESSLVG
jgi:NAD(P)-dependent dehydrogenase (short-subunit alcohol dehydrogenase family)